MTGPPLRLAIVATHPVQYYAPLYRTLAGRCDLTVFYAHQPDATQQAEGFGTAFTWDVDLLSGYDHVWLKNISPTPNPSTRRGCDTPEIGARLAEGGFDAVLVMGWYTRSHIQAIRACKRLGIPVFVRSDSHLARQPARWKRALKALTYPVVLRFFDAACYVGQNARDFFLSYRYPTGRLFHAPHAIDTDHFASGATAQAAAAFRQDQGISPQTRIILFVGKLMALKRPFDVVDAIAALPPHRDPVHYVVAGTGALEEALIAHATAQGVPLTVLGFVNQSALPAVYASASCVVLPSAYETWGLVTNEALAAGTPVIVSDAVGSAPDIAADGRVGQTYPVGDTHALALALDRVLNDPPSAADIQAVSDRFTLARAAQGILTAAQAIVRR